MSSQQSSAVSLNLSLVRRLPGSWTVAAAFVLTLAALLLLMSRTHLMTPDSTEYALVARNLAEGLGYTADFVTLHMTWYPEVRHVPEMHGLLQPVMLASLFKVFGPENGMVRALGLFFLVGTALLTFLLGRRLYGSLCGALSAALLLTTPTTLVIAVSGNDDVGFAFFFVGSVLALVAGLESGRDRDFLLAGAAGAFALLEKLAGLILPGLWVGALLFPVVTGRWPARRALRAMTLVVPPFAFALACYLMRNQVTSGQMMFRLGALDWILKTGGYGAAYAIHDPLPSLGEMLRELGPSEVLRISLDQVRLFLGALLPTHPGPLPIWSLSLGLVSMPFAWRAAPSYGWICTLALLGTLAFICGLYHVEDRYFIFLLPLFLICAVGGAQSLLHSFRESPRLQRGLAFGLSLSVCGLLAYNLWSSRRWVQYTAEQPEHVCDEARDWLRRESPAEARVLTLDPWGTTWTTRRASVFVPNGPVEDALRVARHYDTQFLLVQPNPYLAEATQAAEQLRSEQRSDVRVEHILGDASCSLYRMDLGGEVNRSPALPDFVPGGQGV